MPSKQNSLQKTSQKAQTRDSDGATPWHHFLILRLKNGESHPPGDRRIIR